MSSKELSEYKKDKKILDNISQRRKENVPMETFLIPIDRLIKVRNELVSLWDITDLLRKYATAFKYNNDKNDIMKLDDSIVRTFNIVNRLLKRVTKEDLMILRL